MRTHPTAPLKVWIAATTIVLSSLIATHALADCDEDQEVLVGKTIATAAIAKIGALVPGAGKQMINVESCTVEAGALAASFKFNVIGSDGLYWVTGKAKVSGKDVRDLSFVQLSPNLASASSAKGIKLASN